VDKAQQDRVKKRFGARLRHLRMAKDMTQEDVAFAADLDRSYLSGIERGKKNLSLVNIHRIANALGVGAEDLFVS
jgi:transcriptional regulator with XRE-family HTH domain